MTHVQHPKEKEILQLLRSSSSLRDSVLRWITEKNYHKVYQKCNMKLNADCMGVGLREQFHGQRCPACTRTYRRSWDERRRASTKKKSKKASVSFKKGTKSQ